MYGLSANLVHSNRILSSLTNRLTDEPTTLDIDEKNFKLLLMSSLKLVHGDYGLSATLDILKVKKDEKRVFIRFSAKHFVHVRSAISFVTNYQGINCHLRVDHVAYSLSSLPLEI